MFSPKIRRLLVAATAMVLVLSIAAAALAAYETIPYGEESHRVRTLQTALKRKGYYKGSVDGKFGPGTKAAVRKYQAAVGLTTDGHPGNRTLTALYDGLSAANEISTSTRLSMAQPKNPNTLAYGQTNQRVRSLQSALKVLGYYKGAVDGKYGDMTLAAVRSFQRAMGLHVDGMAGARTLALINAKQKEVRVGTTVVLAQGSSGDMVSRLQNALAEHGFYNRGDADGTFGPETLAAVIAYQQTNGLKVTGSVPQNLYNNLTVYSPTPERKKYSTIRPGETGSSVVGIKTRLVTLKFLASYNTTDVYDGATEAAVTAFQTAHGLHVDGIAGNETLTLLYKLVP